MGTRVALRAVSVVGNNPAAYREPISVKVVLEVFEKPPLHPIDVKFMWRPIWDFPVDQDLDEFEVGPLASLGAHELLLQSDPPDVAKIPDPTGPTALIISFSYRGREFLHIGYNAVVVCEGDMPDVFESDEQLSRHLTQCFPKEISILWDDGAGAEGDCSLVSGDSEGSSDSEDIAPPLKKSKQS